MSDASFLFATTISPGTGFNWRPGIGDPTVAGWATVVLYALAALWFWVVVVQIRNKLPNNQKELQLWRCLLALFVALGINKQLDLQTALTELGRQLAYSQGWYAQRGDLQLLFVAGVAITGLIASGVLLFWAANAPFPTWIAILGTVGVVGYVLIRAASFHHVDRFIGERFLGLRWNWILEMGGISIAWLGAYMRARQLARVRRPLTQPVVATQVRNSVRASAPNK